MDTVFPVSDPPTECVSVAGGKGTAISSITLGELLWAEGYAPLPGLAYMQFLVMCGYKVQPL